MLVGEPEGVVEEAHPLFAQIPQDARRWQLLEIAEHLALVAQGVRVMRHRRVFVEDCADGLEAIEDVAGPGPQWHPRTILDQHEPRLPAPHRDGQFVVLVGPLFGVRDLGAVGDQAENQEGFEKAQVLLGDPGRAVRVAVQRAHLDVLDAALPQRCARPFAGTCRALGPHVAVELVFDLQDVGIQLDAAVAIVEADGLVVRIRRGDGPAQARHIGIEVVIGDVERGLVLVLVAYVAHPQRGRIGQVVRTAVELLEAGGAAAEE